MTTNTEGEPPYYNSNYAASTGFTLNDTTGDFSFYLNIDGSGFDPGLTGTVTQISLTSGQNATSVAASFAAAIQSTGAFNVVNNGDGTITVSNLIVGAVADLTESMNLSFQVEYQGGTVNRSVKTDNAPAYIETADVNGDGFQDMLVSDSAVGLGVWLGNGDGSFQVRRRYHSPAGGFLGRFTTADMNGDGHLDVIAAPVGASSFIMLFGNGDGSFKEARSVNTSSDVFSTTVTDLNNDGIQDVVSTHGISNYVTSFLGNGDGTFRLVRTTSVNSSQVPAVLGDLNGDGRADLVTFSSSDNYLSVSFGNGDGTFLARVSYSIGSTSNSVKLSDVNRDGTLDIVTAGGVVKVLMGNTDGSFRSSVSYVAYVAGASFTGVEVTDMNADGNHDLVILNQSGLASSLYILLGNSDGSFRAKTSFSAGTYGYDLALADVNGDGIKDALSTNYVDYNVALIFGRADSNGRRNNIQEQLDLTTISGARTALATTRTQLRHIASELGAIGAIQSRLATAHATLQNSRENFRTASSQLMDADLAQESAALVRTQIRQRAAASVLAQANLQPNLAIRLLKPS